MYCQTRICPFIDISVTLKALWKTGGVMNPNQFLFFIHSCPLLRSIAICIQATLHHFSMILHRILIFLLEWKTWSKMNKLSKRAKFCLSVGVTCQWAHFGPLSYVIQTALLKHNGRFGEDACWTTLFVKKATQEVSQKLGEIQPKVWYLHKFEKTWKQSW